MREKLKHNWLIILISIIVGMFIIPVFKFFFLNPNIKNSFDLGGFTGSIIGVLGAYLIAKWQFEKQSNAERELKKEIYLRRKKIDELSKGISILEKLIQDIQFTKKLTYKYIKGDKNKEFFEENNIEIQILSKNFNDYISFSELVFIEIDYSKEDEKYRKNILNHRNDIDYYDLDKLKTQINLLYMEFNYLENVLRDKQYSNAEIYMEQIYGLLRKKEESLSNKETVDLEERANKTLIQLSKIRKYNLNKYKQEP